jgi:hypothetical protein
VEDCYVKIMLVKMLGGIIFCRISCVMTRPPNIIIDNITKLSKIGIYDVWRN